MEGLTTQLSKLNPLSKGSSGRRRRNKEDDEEDVGEEVDGNTVAGGGYGGRQSSVTKSDLRVSHALRSFLVREGVLSEAEAGLDSESDAADTEALRALLAQPHVRVPAALTDRSHPLPEYFVSSSHNTYLLGHQLAGQSSATAYERALGTGSRCVEIDAWDGDVDEDEPKVTHGYTLVSNIPFRAVCETIRDVVDREAAAEARGGSGDRGDYSYGPAPILLSLENHCGPHGQRRLVAIMNEVFGDRLLSKPVREEGHAEQGDGSERGEHVSLAQLGSKIAVIVEYHLPDEQASSDSDSDDDDEDAEERRAHAEYREKKRRAAASGKAGGIVPELAGLGVYAQSVKPRDNSWFEDEVAGLKDGPHHHLINVSETGLAAHLAPTGDSAWANPKAKIARHNAHHLMRVFPKGTRISSANLHPVPFWGVGAQICAMNWQTFGTGMQLNEALFGGTDGYVLKPAHLRGASSSSSSGGKRKKVLRLRVAGATGVPIPPHQEVDEDEIRPYVTCTLIHPDTLDARAHPKRKTAAYRQHRFTGFLHRHGDTNPPNTDPLWNETLEWEYDDDEELTFLRILIKSDVSFAANPMFAVAAVRLLYVITGEWRFVRMLDLKGHETGCSLLVRFEIEDA